IKLIVPQSSHNSGFEGSLFSFLLLRKHVKSVTNLFAPYEKLLPSQPTVPSLHHWTFCTACLRLCPPESPVALSERNYGWNLDPILPRFQPGGTESCHAGICLG